MSDSESDVPPQGPPPYQQPFGSPQQPAPQQPTPQQQPGQQQPGQQQYPQPYRGPYPGPYAGPPPMYRPPYPGGPGPYPYPQGPPLRRQSSTAWVVPVSIAAALVTGLVGGLLSGALLVGSRDATVSGSEGPLPKIDEVAPLDPDNTSVAAVAAKVLPSTVQVKVVNGKGANATGATGSGFLVDAEGHIITNNHVVEVAEDNAVITVVGVDGRSRAAEVVGRSPVYDVAVLSVKNVNGLRPARLGSSRKLVVGETVVAIGSPLGLSSTVTSGIVSAVDRPVSVGSQDASSYINAVQTDAAINPGNSGGPLVNLRGQVVGVNSAIATTGGGLGGGESGNIGVGFAIPMEQVRYTANQILDRGKAEYPVIGANVRSSQTKRGADIVDAPEGGTPAADAGLKAGDRIIEVQGKMVIDANSLIVAIRSYHPGETIELTVVNDSGERTVKITLDGKVG